MRILWWVPLTVALANVLCACQDAATTDQTLLKSAQTLIEQKMHDSHTPGVSYAIIQGGRTVLSGGVGFANIETNTQATADSEYNAAPLSKAFLSDATLMLVQRKKLALEDKACAYLEACPTSWQQITIRQLLTHTSGLVRDPDDYQPYHDRTVAATIQAFSATPLHASPGTSWLYSNMGYYMIAEIISKASGEPWDVFISETILKPAGMTATYLNATDTVIANRANGYSYRDGHYLNAERWIVSRPSSAYISTVGDLAKWDAFLDKQAAGDGAFWKQLWTPAKLSNGELTRYGYGWYVDTYLGSAHIHHDGQYPGFRSDIERFPDEHLSVIVMANSESFPAEKTAIKLAGLANARLAGPTFEVTARADAHELPVGKPISLPVQLTDTATASPDTVVEIEVWDASNHSVYKEHREHLTFSPGERRTETFTWVPQKVGDYTVNIGVYGGHWMPDFAWKQDAADLHIR